MLEESPCGDCLVHLCCEPCALCQEHRELRIRGFDTSLGMYIFPFIILLYQWGLNDCIEIMICIGWQGNPEKHNGGVTMAPIVPQSGMNR